MGFSFLHFLGNFGDQNNQDDQKNRHGVIGFLEDAGQSFVKTANDVGNAIGSSNFNPAHVALEKNKDAILNPNFSSPTEGLKSTFNFMKGFTDVGIANSPVGAAERTLQRGVAQVGGPNLDLYGSGGETGSFTDAFDPNKGGSALGGALSVGGDLLGAKDIVRPTATLAKGAANVVKGESGALDLAAPILPQEAPTNTNLFHGSEGGRLKVDNNGNVNLGHSANDVSQFGDVVKLPTDNIVIEQVPTKNEMFKIAADAQLKQDYIDRGVDVLQADNHSIAINPDNFSKKTGVPLRPSPRSMTIEEAMAAQQAAEGAPKTLDTQSPAESQQAPETAPTQSTEQPGNMTPPPTEPMRSPVPEGDTGGPEISALDKLHAKTLKGVPTKEDSAVKLTDIGEPKTGPVKSAVNSVYSKLTKGDNLDSRVSKIKTSLYKKYTPLSDLSNKYQELTGETLTPENDPAKLAALSAGAEAKFKARVGELDNAVKSVGAKAQDVKDLGQLRQMATDRSGMKNPLSPKEISQAMSELEAKLGPEQFAKTEKAVKNVQKIQREMLDYMGEVIGKDSVERISAGNPNYFTKFDAVDHLIDNHESIKLGSSFNHATQDFIHAKGKGFEGNVADPFESMIRQWGKITGFVESNKVGQAIGKMADNLDASLGEENNLAIKLRNESDVKEQISLSLENKEMRPVAKRLERLLSTREKWGRQLYTEVAKLEQKGLDLKLGKAVDEPSAKGKAFNYENRDFMRNAETTARERGVKDIGAAREVSGTVEQQLRIKGGASASETRSLVNSLIDLPPKDFTGVMKKLELRDSKLSDILGEVESIRNEAQGVRENIKTNRGDIHELADKPIPEGYEKISYFKNGVKEEVALPKEVADAMKNMNAKQADFITKTASLQSRVLRTGATSLNIAFIPKNIIRDFQTASVNTQHQAFKDLAVNWVKAFGDAWVGGPTTKAFIEAGGGQAGFFSRGAGNVEKIAQGIGETRSDKWGRLITSPKDLAKEIASIPFKGLTKIGEASELAPRLAEFKAAQADGLSSAASAYAGRNITVDFAQAGELGQIANQWVPFLNARLQGNVNIWKAIKRDPARASAVIATTMVAPTVATYLWNRQNFTDVYDQIPDYVKQNNFVMIYGNATDEAGNFTQVLKIPKGEVGQIFGNPLENLLDYAYGHNPESLAGIANDTLSQVSPISFSRKGQVDPGLAVSSVLPPALKGTLENTANFSFFRGAPVVSDKLKSLPTNEQSDKNTSPAAKFIGEITGQSPLKVDNMIQAVGGGLGQQLANPSKFVTSPVNSFKGASSNEVDNQFYSVLDKTSPLRASASKKINEAIQSGNLDTAQTIAQNYNDKLRASFKPFVKEYGHLATKDMVDQFQKQKINLTSATISQRSTAIKAARKKQQHAQEMAGAIT